MPRAAPRRGDVWGGGTNGGRLLGHELDEGADDAVELVMHGGVLSDVTRDHRDLQTSERLARGAERTVITRVPIAAPTIHTLRQVESSAAAAEPGLCP